MGHSTFQSHIIFLVAGGKIETDGVVEFLNFFQYDLLQCFAEFFSGVVFFNFKPTNDQAFQLIQLAGSL